MPESFQEQGRRAGLSAREMQVALLVAQGYKNKEIGEKLFISEQTAKNHLHNIFDELGVKDRFELALYAVHKGWHIDASSGLKRAEEGPVRPRAGLKTESSKSLAATAAHSAASDPKP